MPHFSIRMADKMAAKIVFNSLHAIRRRQNNILTRSVYRESRFAETESETEFRDAFKKSLSAKVLAADVFWSRATSPSTMKNRKREKGRKRKTEKGGKRRTEKGEREREKERDGRRLGATEPFQRTILFADTHVQRERSFFGVSDSNRVLLPDSDVLEGA